MVPNLKKRISLPPSLPPQVFGLVLKATHPYGIRFYLCDGMDRERFQMMLKEGSLGCETFVWAHWLYPDWLSQWSGGQRLE